MLRKWILVNRGAVPEPPQSEIEYSCPRCGKDSLLPILGAAMAQINGGVVFDVGPHAMPVEIRCPHCRREFVTEGDIPGVFEA